MVKVHPKEASTDEAGHVITATHTSTRRPGYSNCKPLAEKIILATICVGVAVAIHFTVVVYVTKEKRPQNFSSLTSNLKFNENNCSLIQANSSSSYNDICSPYNGVCKSLLLVNGSSEISTYMLTTVTETDVANFLNTVALYESQGLVRDSCYEVIRPLVCQYVYPPCDNNGVASTITQQNCISVRDETCDSEWSSAMMVGLSSVLPDCSNLESNETHTDDMVIDDGSSGNESMITCHEQFGSFCGVCLPLCGKFIMFNTETSDQVDAVTLVASFFAISGGIVVFIFAIVRRKTLLVFPASLIVYSTLCTTIVAILNLITYVGGRERLYCTHETLHISVQNPSVFCQIAGFLYHVCVMLMMAFWMLNVVHIFLRIVFPFASQRINEKLQLLHFTEVVGSVILCSMAPIVYISTSEYRMTRFPPLLCVPSVDVYFYTISIPLCLILTIGVNLLIITLWRIHKASNAHVHKKSCFHLEYFSVPEIKILLTSCYFAIFGILSIITLNISIRNEDHVVKSTIDYFKCQITGNNEMCRQFKLKLESYLFPGLSGTVYFILGTITWSNVLLFVLQIKDVKKLLLKLCTRK